MKFGGSVVCSAAVGLLSGLWQSERRGQQQRFVEIISMEAAIAGSSMCSRPLCMVLLTADADADEEVAAKMSMMTAALRREGRASTRRVTSANHDVDGAEGREGNKE